MGVYMLRATVQDLHGTAQKIRPPALPDGRNIRSRDDDGTNAAVIGDLGERGMQARDQRFRKAVALRRAVQRQHGDRADVFAQQDRLLWRGSSRGEGHRRFHS